MFIVNTEVPALIKSVQYFFSPFLAVLNPHPYFYKWMRVADLKFCCLSCRRTRSSMRRRSSRVTRRWWRTWPGTCSTSPSSAVSATITSSWSGTPGAAILILIPLTDQMDINHGFGSVLIWYGSGSGILGWIPIRVRIQSGPGFCDQKMEKITAVNFFFWIKNYNLPIPRPS